MQHRECYCKELLGIMTLQFCISGNNVDLYFLFLFKFLVKQIYERFLENQKDLQTLMLNGNEWRD